MSLESLGYRKNQFLEETDDGKKLLEFADQISQPQILARFPISTTKVGEILCFNNPFIKSQADRWLQYRMILLAEKRVTPGELVVMRLATVYGSQEITIGELYNRLRNDFAETGLEVHLGELEPKNRVLKTRVALDNPEDPWFYDLSPLIGKRRGL